LSNSRDLKNLKKRYLIWLYKTTKEELDRIDRKFTQLDIDKFMIKTISKKISLYNNTKKKSLNKFLIDLKNYIKNKEEAALKARFKNSDKSTTKDDYIFLKLKLETIEKAIKKVLGKNILFEIKNLYEQEMIKRILEERVHR